MGKERLYREGAKVDDRNRITISLELLKEMNLKPGETVNIYANFEENKIVIKKKAQNE
jgi:bifunctional DNA-binding transcriptional regulator/antitoxin component of YhaV-PrlF toxin-antitoxin module